MFLLKNKTKASISLTVFFLFLTIFLVRPQNADAACGKVEWQIGGNVCSASGNNSFSYCDASHDPGANCCDTDAECHPAETPLPGEEDRTRVDCGYTVAAERVSKYSCGCENGVGFLPFEHQSKEYQCCGWVNPISVNGETFDACTGVPDVVIPGTDITKGLDNSAFDRLNPLKIAGSPVSTNLSTPGGILSRLLSFLFPLAGLILFLLISWGGFEILISSANQKGIEAGRNRITAGIIGFMLLFSSYWMAQIVEVVFGIRIL